MINLKNIIGSWLFGCLVVSYLPAASSSVPSCDAITPPIGMRGEPFRVTATGSSLNDVVEVISYREGLTCTRIEPINEERVNLFFVSDSGCPLGSYPIRLRTSSGLTELRTITLTPFPILQEENIREQSLGLNQTVWGTLEGNQVDTFSIELTAGELFSCEVHAMRLGGNFLDTKITLDGPSGQVVVQVDDSPLFRQDPCFSLRVRESGVHKLSIRSVDGRADADSHYALHIGNFPRPSNVFPMGGLPNQPVEVTLRSHDNQIISKTTIDTSGLQEGTHSLPILSESRQAPSPVPFRVTQGTHYIVPKNRTHEQPKLATPCAIHGRLETPSQPDEVRFTASESGQHRIEIFASRLGSQLDSIVEIYDERAFLLARSDDFDGLDSRLHISLTAGHEYLIRVTDKHQSASAFHSYCLEIVPGTPSLTAFLPRQDKRSQRRQAISVPAGNRSLVLLGLQKHDFFSQVDLELNGLPPGVAAQIANDQPETFVIPVVIDASESASPSACLAEIGSKSPHTPPVHFEQVIDLINGPADTLFHSITVNKLAVAVTTPVPYSIELESPRAPLVKDGELGVRVRVKRAEGFALPIDVRIPQLPEWVECVEKIQFAQGTNEAIFSLRASEEAMPTNWALIAEGAPPNQPFVASTLQKLVLTDSPCRGKMDAVSAEQGSTVELVCQLDFDGTVPKSLTATLEGLPKRVEAKPVVVSSSEQLVRFHLEIPTDSPLGRFTDVYCRLSGELEGMPVSYFVARRTTLVISPKGASEKDDSGRPLSPLEALRRKNPISRIQERP